MHTKLSGDQSGEAYERKTPRYYKVGMTRRRTTSHLINRMKVYIHNPVAIVHNKILSITSMTH